MANTKKREAQVLGWKLYWAQLSVAKLKPVKKDLKHDQFPGVKDFTQAVERVINQAKGMPIRKKPGDIDYGKAATEAQKALRAWERELRATTRSRSRGR
eukprot:g25519.t1